MDTSESSTTNSNSSTDSPNGSENSNNNSQSTPLQVLWRIICGCTANINVGFESLVVYYRSLLNSQVGVEDISILNTTLRIRHALEVAVLSNSRFRRTITHMLEESTNLSLDDEVTLGNIRYRFMSRNLLFRTLQNAVQTIINRFYDNRIANNLNTFTVSSRSAFEPNALFMSRNEEYYANQLQRYKNNFQFSFSYF